MTPAPGATSPALAMSSVAIDRSRQSAPVKSDLVREPVLAGRAWGIPEQLLDPVPALLHPGQRQTDLGDAEAHQVERRVAGDQHEQLAAVADRIDAVAGEPVGELVSPLLHLDCQHL